MAAYLDARIPVLLACSPADVRPDDAWLVEGDHHSEGAPIMARFTPDLAHDTGCACCAGRSDAARALASLFLDRARGKTAFFRRVLLMSKTPAGRDAVAEALASDVLVSRWFRQDKKALLF